MKAPYQIIEKYLSIFKKNSLPRAVNSLKGLMSVDMIRNVATTLSAYYPSISVQIQGMLSSMDIKKVAEQDRDIFFRPDSLLSEINWALSYMHGHWNDLNWFVNQKKEFEHQFLIGSYANCHEILSNIKDKLGVSLWYYDAICVLYEFEGKESDGMEFISNTLVECKDNKNHIPYLIYNLHVRSSRKLSPYKFDENLNAHYKKNRTELHEDYYRYILYRLNYYNQYKETDLSCQIMFESVSTLVDRYLMVVSVIKTATIREIDMTNIIPKGVYLHKKTRDASLLPIIAIRETEMPLEYYNKDFTALLDSYYEGNYVKCKKLSIQVLNTDSSIFDALVFYCRSLIYLGDKYSNPITKNINAPVNLICQKIYEVLSYKDAKNNLYKLYQLNKNLYSFQLSAALDNFIKTESNEPIDERVKLFNILYFDPLFTRVLESEDALIYLSKYPKDSLACRIWKKRISHEFIDEKKLPEYIIGPINAEYYYRKKEFQLAYECCDKLYSNAQNCVPIRQTAAARMIDCLYQENKIEKAINLYVKLYVEDIASVAKVDTNTIIAQLQEMSYENIRRSIEVVIFVILSCKDVVDKSFILFEFCELNGTTMPSQLWQQLKEKKIDSRKVELLFLLMNDDEILRHFFSIESYKERLVERKKNLLYIISLDSQKKEIYQQSLKKIEDALLVYNLSCNIDDSKIYANDEAIINHKLTGIEGLFNRYRLLMDSVISKRKNIFVLNLNNSSFFGENGDYDRKSYTNISISNNGLNEIFRELYTEIKEQFLYSDYGLVAYLSTRVRHGELESMLRPIMAQLHLILSTRQDTYQNDNYWSSTYNLNPKENQVINEALTHFSREFDSAVTSLIKDKLQIYDNKDKPDGLFNYDVEENELEVKAMEIGLILISGKDDQVTFCQLVLKWLWEKTEANLSVIRKYLDNDFTDRICGAINTLETKVKKQLPAGHAKNDMLENIRISYDTIMSKTKRISKWFNVSQPKLEDVDLFVVTQQVCEALKLSATYCTRDASLTTEGESFKIKSYYVIHYADILRNVITNCFEHGVDGADGKRKLELFIKVVDEQILLEFINLTSRNEDELNTIFYSKLNDQTLVSGEGGSGIAKVNKILKIDLNNKANSINMHAEDGKCTTLIIIKTNDFKAMSK